MDMYVRNIVSLGESPRIAVIKKNEDSLYNNNPNKSKRDNENNNVRLPPKPPMANNGNNVGSYNYKLPPKPVYQNNPHNPNNVNRSMDREAQNSREKSRENLRNVGINIINS
jgi:hypothetical protein